MALTTPVIRAVGTFTGGTGAITPNIPTGTLTGDLLIFFLQTGSNLGAMASSTPSWNILDRGNHDNLSVGLGVFWRIAEADGNTGPRSTTDSGDHQYGGMISIQTGTFNASDPIILSASGYQEQFTGSSQHQAGGGTTDVNQCMTFTAFAGHLPDSSNENGASEYDSWSNAALVSVTEDKDGTTFRGSGGSIGIAHGEKATAGAYSGTYVTPATTADACYISFYVKPYDSGGGGVTVKCRIALLGVGK